MENDAKKMGEETSSQLCDACARATTVIGRRVSLASPAGSVLKKTMQHDFRSPKTNIMLMKRQKIGKRIDRRMFEPMASHIQVGTRFSHRAPGSKREVGLAARTLCSKFD